MPMYLTFAKYSPAAAASIYREGLVGRRKILEAYVSGLGGRLVDCYAVADEEWDIVSIMEADNLTPSRMVNHTLLTFGSGAIERSRTYQMATFEEADQDRRSMPG